MVASPRPSSSVCVGLCVCVFACARILLCHFPLQDLGAYQEGSCANTDWYILAGAAEEGALSSHAAPPCLPVIDSEGQRREAPAACRLLVIQPALLHFVFALFSGAPDSPPHPPLSSLMLLPWTESWENENHCLATGDHTAAVSCERAAFRFGACLSAPQGLFFVLLKCDEMEHAFKNRCFREMG